MGSLIPSFPLLLNGIKLKLYKSEKQKSTSKDNEMEIQLDIHNIPLYLLHSGPNECSSTRDQKRLFVATSCNTNAHLSQPNTKHKMDDDRCVCVKKFARFHEEYNIRYEGSLS